MKNLCLLGASGSIGSQTLEVLNELKSKYRLVAVSIGNNVQCLKEKVLSFYEVKYVYLDNEEEKINLKKEYKNIKFYSRKDSIITFLKEIDSKIDIYFNALSGFFGLKPSLFVLNRNKKLLLANKESLVIGGELIKKIPNYKKNLFPVDSEHAAIRKCLANVSKKDIEYICLTCSGGPFFNLNKEDFKFIKAKDCLKHPTYKMGKKISIDSSTLINKAFEIIEAYYLFNIGYKKIKVLINRESYVHSFIKLKNGTFKLSCGEPNMKIQIKDALNLFKHKKNEEFLDTEINTFDNYKFYEVDKTKFPLIDYGYKVIKEKGISGLLLNDVVEICDALLLKDEIKYIDIKQIIDKIFEMYNKDIILDYYNIDILHEDIIKFINKIIINKEY